MKRFSTSSIEITAILLLLLAAWRLHDMGSYGYHPYSFYQFGRLIVLAAWFTAAYLFWNARIVLLVLISVFVGAWFNPFVPVRMRRVEWVPYDNAAVWLSVTCAVLIAWLAYHRRAHRPRA
ncbi:MAG TPA: DUF6804 family protein [Candidatus Sulfotelmatobacter sp.]|nr:DUF6804 family protein [Candidatus Sulfotelmatobacter sp.]